MGNWKKSENENGFLYYTNLETNTNQWDHPKFSEIKQAIDDCNYVAYPSYRLALKFRVLQRSLHMEEVPLSIITAIFDRHRLGNSESSLKLETCDLEAVLSDIFFAANKKNHTNIDIDFATELLMNFLFNVYDAFREGNIQVFSAKVLIGILSNGSLLEVYKFLFVLCADHNNCITRLRLQGLLLKLFEIIKYLHEDAYLGLQSVNFATERCFQNSPGLVGITENNFISWLKNDPHFLSWLSLVTTLKNAETVMHSVKCATCKTRPLMGLRYRCVKCSRYTQCQRCFLTARISHSHKLSHSVRQYSGKNISKDNSETFIRKMCNYLCPVTLDTSFSVIRPTSCFISNTIRPYQAFDPLCDVEPLSSPQSQLQNVIRQLESQNRELQQMLIFGNYNDKDMRKYLDEYRIFMAGNIKKLKMLKEQINTKTYSKVAEYKCLELNDLSKIQSTPMAQFNKVGSSGNIAIKNDMTFMVDSLCKDYSDVDKEKRTSNVKVPQCNKNLRDYKGYTSWSKETHYPVPDSTTMDAKCDIFVKKSPVKLLHNDLDEALARLQQILANNFSLEDSLNPMDNTNLKYAVTEVEGMLTSIIDNVETSRSSSALPGRAKS